MYFMLAAWSLNKIWGDPVLEILERHNATPRTEQETFRRGTLQDEIGIRQIGQFVPTKLLAPVIRLGLANDVSQTAILEVKVNETNEIKSNRSIHRLDVSRVLAQSRSKIFDWNYPFRVNVSHTLKNFNLRLIDFAFLHATSLSWYSLR